jgi:GNAT superfamily N-acetyltransferase
MFDGSRNLLGYYTLSAYTVQLGELPEKLSKKLPRYPLLPATLLGRLAIDGRSQGRGFGSLLLMDALYRCWESSSQVASVAVVAESYDDKAKQFYLRHDFQPLRDHPLRVCLPMGYLKKVFGGAI